MLINELSPEPTSRCKLKQGAIVHGLSWQPLAHMHAFGYLPTLFCWNVKGVCLG